MEHRKFTAGTEEVFPSPQSELDGIDVERKHDEVWISTEARDASGLGDIVRANGGDFTDFMKNPVIYWDHGRRLDLPIARAPEVPKNQGGRISAKVDWVPWGNNEDIDAIHRLWDGKFINAVSIRFLIKNAIPLPGHEKDWWPPLDIQKWVLREFSIVGVGMNQDALRKSAFWLMTGKQFRQQRRRDRFKLLDQKSHAAGAGLESQFTVPPNVLAGLFNLGIETQKTLEKLQNGK